MEDRVKEMGFKLASYVNIEKDFIVEYNKYLDSKARLDSWYAAELASLGVEEDVYAESKEKLEDAILLAEGKLDSNISKLDELLEENDNYLGVLLERFGSEYDKGSWRSSKYGNFISLDDAFEVRDRTYGTILEELEGKEELSSKLSGVLSKWFKGLYSSLFGKDAGVSKVGGALIVVGFLITLYKLIFGRGNIIYKLLLIGIVLFVLYGILSPKMLLDNSLVMTCYSSIDYIDKKLKSEKLKVEKYYKQKIARIKSRSKCRLGDIERSNAELKNRKRVYIEYEYDRRLESLSKALGSKFDMASYDGLEFGGVQTSELGFIETFNGFKIYPRYDLTSLNLLGCGGDKLIECVEDIIDYRPGSLVYLVDLGEIGKSYTQLYSEIGDGFDRIRDDLVVTDTDFLRMHERVVRRSSQVLRDKSLGLDISGYNVTYIVYTGEVDPKYVDMVYELNSLEEAGVYCIYRNINIEMPGVSVYNCREGRYVSYKGYKFEGVILDENVCDGAVR